MKEILFSGFGGQGVLTAGLLMAKIGVSMDRCVTWIPSYGMEMRGGTANCSVKIDDLEIASPFIQEADALVALNEPSVVKFMHQIRPDGLLVVDSSNIDKVDYREDIRVIEVPAVEICNRHENPRGLNLAVLGALATGIGLFEKAAYLAGIAEMFKKYAHMHEKNVAVFEAGYAMA